MGNLKFSPPTFKHQFIDTFILLLLVQASWSSVSFELSSSNSQSLQNGRKRLEEITQNVGVPYSGDCWRSALDNLEVGCKLLTENVHIRMALRFTSCFVEMLGNPPLMCEPSTPTKDCLKGIDDFAKSSFREYFLHTQDMCHYLRQEIWQETTNNAVNKLSVAADDVTNQLQMQKQIQVQIYNSQQESLQVQNNMKKDSEDLYNTVVKVKDVFDDFSEAAKEHQMVSTEIFEKLSRMQKLVSWIQGEMSMVDMIFWYFGAMLFGYFATTSERTRAARFWLIILFMITILMEKILFHYLTRTDTGLDLGPEDVQRCISIVRNGAAVFGIFTIILSAAIYRDAVSDQKTVLMNMQFTLEKVAETIKNQKAKYDNYKNEGQILDGTNGDDEDFSNDDDSFSNYSSEDSTYKLEFELKDLNDEQNENNENVQPGGTSGTGLLSLFSTSRFTDPTRSPLVTDRTRRYNFRERSTPNRENDLIQQESVTEFAKAVKRKTAVNNPSYFSSDDDDGN